MRKGIEADASKNNSKEDKEHNNPSGGVFEETKGVSIFGLGVVLVLKHIMESGLTDFS